MTDPRESLDAQARLLGNWRCAGTVATTADGKAALVLDDGMIAFLPDGRMHVLVRCDVERSDPAQLAVVGKCFGYFGTYTVHADPPSVSTHVEGSTQEAWVGRTLPRRFRFSDDGRTLELTAELEHQATGQLAWKGREATVLWTRVD